MIPYDIQAPFWSDHADKRRYLALPQGTTIAVGAEDDWQFPVGSVLRKDFRLGEKLIETRLLMFRPDGGSGSWEGVTYRWNSDESSAQRVVGGLTEDIQGQQWIFPSGGQCLECHTGAAGVALGPETAQLNGSFTYPSTGILANQLHTLDSIGMFDTPLPAVTALPALVDPFDASADLADRARAYLHTNCAQCHRPGSGIPASVDFRYQTALPDMQACDVVPGAGDLGLGTDARLIAPGNPSLSVVIARMSRRDAHGMPPLGSNIADAAGADLLSDWIESLQTCN